MQRTHSDVAGADVGVGFPHSSRGQLFCQLQQNNIDTNPISLEYSAPLGLPFLCLAYPAFPAPAGCGMKPQMGYDKQRALRPAASCSLSSGCVWLIDPLLLCFSITRCCFSGRDAVSSIW